MARTLAMLPEGSRITDYISLGVITKTFALDRVRSILAATGKPESLIQYVTDRPGHDLRYALTNEKLTKATGWQPQMTFDEGLAVTVRWYRENQTWVQRVKSGAYQTFYEQNYANR